MRIHSQTSSVAYVHFEIWEWISKFVQYFIMDVNAITYPCWYWIQSSKWRYRMYVSHIGLNKGLAPFRLQVIIRTNDVMINCLQKSYWRVAPFSSFVGFPKYSCEMQWNFLCDLGKFHGGNIGIFSRFSMQMWKYWYCYISLFGNDVEIIVPGGVGILW